MSDTHSPRQWEYGRKSILYEVCLEVLACMKHYKEDIAYRLIYPIVRELEADITNIKNTLTLDEIVSSPLPVIHNAGSIRTYCLRAAELASHMSDTTDPAVWDSLTAEHYMGRLYDRTSGALLWHVA
jgi:hypothetical protein